MSEASISNSGVDWGPKLTGSGCWKKMKLCLMVLFAILKVISCERQLQYPGRNEKLKIVLKNNWEMYYKCLNKSYEKINEVKAYYVLPGQSIRLNCTECVKPFDDAYVYTWKQRAMDLNATFVDYENLSEDFTLRGLNDLVMRNAKPEYSGIYQCFRGGGYLSSHIIEIPEQPVIVPTQHSELSNNWTEFQIEWGEWSKCSKCGVVGKRFQYGTCVLRYNKIRIFSKLSCFSRFLDNATKHAISKARATNFAVVELCKVDCETSENSGFKEKKGNLLGLFQTASEREIIKVYPKNFLIVQCPRIIDETIPVTWKVLNMEIIPESIQEQTKGRIIIDFLNRLQFRETKRQDSNVYSCWQQKKLIGIIHLDVDQETKTHAKFLPIVTALSIIFLAIHIALKSIQHKSSDYVNIPAADPAASAN